MKTFKCSNCGHAAYFDNTACVHCGMRLGYEPDTFDLVALRAEDGVWRDTDGRLRQFCANAEHDACNWLIGEGSGAYCKACRHNGTVPDLSREQDRDNWRRIEAAKRHLFYSLLRWRPPTPNRAEQPATGLAFDFLADVEQPDGSVERVLTGHDEGLITLNIAEGDDAERERRRTQLGEPYRTLLGHLRHEVGHYYWDRLVADRGNLDRCREIFGDERADYGDALKAHYANGPVAGWQQAFISSYAASHPWEDFAETWAHYLHIVDTLETASAFGMKVRHPDGQETTRLFDPYRTAKVETLIDAWVPLTVAINAVNRSMGQPDLYPFVLSVPVVGKLQFVADMIRQGGYAD